MFGIDVNESSISASKVGWTKRELVAKELAVNGSHGRWSPNQMKAVKAGRDFFTNKDRTAAWN